MKFKKMGSIFLLLSIVPGFAWASQTYDFLPSSWREISMGSALGPSLLLLGLGRIVAGILAVMGAGIVAVMGAGILAIVVLLGEACDNHGRSC